MLLEKQCMSLEPNCININKVKHATNELSHVNDFKERNTR